MPFGFTVFTNSRLHMILKSIVEKSNSPWALFKNTSSPLSADAFVKARVLSVGGI